MNGILTQSRLNFRNMDYLSHVRWSNAVTMIKSRGARMALWFIWSPRNIQTVDIFTFTVACLHLKDISRQVLQLNRRSWLINNDFCLYQKLKIVFIILNFMFYRCFTFRIIFLVFYLKMKLYFSFSLQLRT